MKSKKLVIVTIAATAALVILLAATVLNTVRIYSTNAKVDKLGTQEPIVKQFDFEQLAIEENAWVAVFINTHRQDGEEYFGKMTKANNEYMVLSDIYYIPDKNNPDISLAKLGCELQGPQDVMYIRKSNVRYWERLKDNGSQVVSAIEDYKEANPKGQVCSRD